MTFLIRGRSRIFRPKTPGSEGPWYADDGCGFIIIDGTVGEKYVLWAMGGLGGGPSVVGPATLTQLVGGQPGIHLITVTGDGEFQINVDSCAQGGLLAHLLPPGSPILSVCG